MATLAPAPILSAVLADLAHDWVIRLMTSRLTLTADEASVLAAALRELAISARQMSDTFQRVVSERNELLGMLHAGTPVPPAPVATGGVLIDLTEFFAREKASRAPHHDGGAA